MKRKGKGIWPVVLALIVIILGVAYYGFTHLVFVDGDYSASPYACANGVNVIVVADPQNASNYRNIVASVRTAVKKGGSNASIVIVAGEYNVDKDSHIENLFASLKGLGLDGVYAYPTNLESFSSPNATTLLGNTYTVPLKDNALCSAGAEFQRKATLLTTRKVAEETAEPYLQIWDIATYERRDVDTSTASVKIVVGGKDESGIACDLYVFTGDAEGKDEGIMGAIGGIGNGKSSFNYELSPSRLFMYCGTSGTKAGDRAITRHAIGTVEIVSVTGD